MSHGISSELEILRHVRGTHLALVCCSALGKKTALETFPPCGAIALRVGIALGSLARPPPRSFPLEWLDLLLNRRGQLSQAAAVNSRSSERNSA